jgi:hypothetical protein
MPTSFSSLKKNSKDFLDSLKKESEKISSKQNYSDPRFWDPEVDPKTGNGSAIIRFLPPAEGEDVPWVRVWRHCFQGPTSKWFIENCPTTIGQDCPVCAENNKLWDTGLKSNQEIVRNRKRQLSYISNIMVISDPNRKENEGKIFLYKYGKKIFDKINNKLFPEFADETSENPFDFWNGCNFRLKIRKLEGYRNYDKSEFDSPSPLSKNEDELLEIYRQLIPLKEFTDASQFKSFEELNAQFLKVWHTVTVPTTAEEDDLDQEIEDKEEVKPKFRKPIASKKNEEVEEDDMPWSKVDSTSVDDEDDAMARFRKIAEED